MIQATDNDLLRATGSQSSAAQFMQEAMRNAAAGRNTQVQPASAGGDSSQVSLSDASKLLNALQPGDAAGNPLASALSRLMEQLTGQKVADINIGSQSLEASSFSYDTVEESLKVGTRSGLDYQYRSLHAEGEQLSYSAQGSIKLEDGTELAFEFKLEMSRVYVEETQARVQVNGAALRDALGSDQPGMRVKPREKGFDVDLDHRGVRRLLEGVEEGARGPGERHRAHGHHDDDDGGRARGNGHRHHRHDDDEGGRVRGHRHHHDNDAPRRAREVETVA